MLLTFSKKTAGIILAAGESKRMGTTKQLLAFQGSTMLEQVISQVRQSLLYERIVVLGHDADRIMNGISFSDMNIIINHDYKKGQSSSLIKGLSLVSPKCSGAMFLLADQPFITTAIINRLLAAFESCEDTGAAFVIPFYKGQRGNPVIAARKIFPELEGLSSDAGARTLFKKYKNEILKVDIEDKGILLDIDTHKEYLNCERNNYEHKH